MIVMRMEEMMGEDWKELSTEEKRERLEAWVDKRTENESIYHKWAREFYSVYDAVMPLYIDVSRLDGFVRAYAGWYADGEITLVREAEPFRRMGIFEEESKLETAKVMGYAKWARERYGWNVTPMLEGHKLTEFTREEVEEIRARAKAERF